MEMKPFLSIASVFVVFTGLVGCGNGKSASVDGEPADSAVVAIAVENPEIYPYRFENGKMGYVDADGNPRVAGKFDMALDFSEGVAAVKMGNRWGYVDGSGDFVIKLGFDEAMPFEAGMAKVKKNSLWGYVDHAGNEVIECNYDRIDTFADGEAYAVRDGKKGIIDRHGSELIQCEFDDIRPYNDNLLALKKGSDYGLAKISDKTVVLQCEYLYPGYAGKHKDSEGNGYIFFKESKNGGKYGLMTESGELVFAPRYDNHADIESNGWVCVWLDNKAGYINLKGEETIPLKYLSIEPIADRYILRSQNDGFSLADNSTGKLLTGGKTYHKMKRFNDRLLYVEDDGDRSGWIDYDGRSVIPCEYNYRASGDFIYLNKPVGDKLYYGLARASDGKILVPCDRYTNIDDFSKRDGRYAEVFTKPHSLFPVGLINSEGKEVIPCNNMYIYRVIDGVAKVKDMQGVIKDVRLKE